MMGNPDAKVKLIEIGSLSCPHCKAFDDEGVPTLIDKYVKSGNVSWEFRPYIIHGPIDMAANLVVRCNGEKTFFPLMQALYKDQTTWLAKIEAAPQDKVTQIQTLPTNQVFVAMAGLLGLQDWAAARGVPAAKSNQCLSDQKMIDHEVQVVTDVSDQYPDFTGTPAFIINGKMLPKEVVDLGDARAEAARGAEVKRCRRALAVAAGDADAPAGGAARAGASTGPARSRSSRPAASAWATPGPRSSWSNMVR